MDREDPRISKFLMLATYLIGGAGIAIGYSTVYDDPPSLTLAALLGAGIPGVLSWLRHSVFHRSDAKRMGWDLGHRNGFQIETGVANLSWGVMAILAVAFDWGIVAEGASLLVFGLYLGGCSIMVTLSPKDDNGHRYEAILGMTVAAIFLIILGIQGITA
ncbi:MAG: DUF6790 family protein [Solirubrobacterales bacterium]